MEMKQAYNHQIDEEGEDVQYADDAASGSAKDYHNDSLVGS